jgi:small subunit ribosomal protein S3
MSRSVTEMNGRVPLQTLRANIDYGVVHAHTTYGRIGVKVCIYRGEQHGERPGTARTEPRERTRPSRSRAPRGRAAASTATAGRGEA